MAAAAAAVAIVTTNLAALFVRPEPPATPSMPVATRVEDERIEVPAGWDSLPVIAHPRMDASVTIASDDLFFTTSVTRRAPLGDVTVEWVEELCSAGGSACAQSSSRLTSLRVGDPSVTGAPQLAMDVTCVATAPFLRDPKNPATRSCAIDSLALRGAPDRNTYVVTFRDPDADERPIAAFARATPLRPSAARGLVRVTTERGGAGWRLLPLLFFAGGALALRTSRRFRRVAAWREERVVDGIVHVDGKPLRLSLDREVNVALVDPAAAERALLSYRELASLDASAVFCGSRAAADVNARAAAVVALVFLAGATLGAVAVSIP